MCKCTLLLLLAVIVLHTEAAPGGKGGGGGGKGGGKGGGGGKGKGLYGRLTDRSGLAPARDSDVAAYYGAGPMAAVSEYQQQHGRGTPGLQYKGYGRQDSPSYGEPYEAPGVRLGGYVRDNHLDSQGYAKVYDDDYAAPIFYPYGKGSYFNRLYLPQF